MMECKRMCERLRKKQTVSVRKKKTTERDNYFQLYKIVQIEDDKERNHYRN